MTTPSELAEFIESMIEEDFVLGTLDHFHNPTFTFCESYGPDGDVYHRIAVLMNGLCYLTLNDEDEFVLILGRPPLEDDSGIVDLTKLMDRIEMFGVDINDWSHTGDDEPADEFSIYSWPLLIDAAESGKRDDIRPILSHFMNVFACHQDYFIQYMDECGCSYFESDFVSDGTFEVAFIKFIKFIQATIIPKFEIKTK